MTLITLITWLKKGWQYTKKILSFVWEYRTIIVIALLLFMMSVMRNDIKNVIDEKEKVAQQFHDYKIQQETEYLKQQVKIKQLEIDLLNENNRLEEEHNVKVKQLQDDLNTSRGIANSLSREVSKAKQRSDVAECSEVRSYSKTVTKLLEDVSGRRDYYASRADEHANAEELAVNKYNVLIESVKQH